MYSLLSLTFCLTFVIELLLPFLIVPEGVSRTYNFLYMFVHVEAITLLFKILYLHALLVITV